MIVRDDSRIDGAFDNGNVEVILQEEINNHYPPTSSPSSIDKRVAPSVLLSYVEVEISGLAVFHPVPIHDIC